MMRRRIVWLPFVLAGCAPVPTLLPQQQPDIEPPYRRIIAERLDTLFSQDAQMRAVSISGVRRIASFVGVEWRVCLRGTANSIAGGSGVRTYAIFINKRNEIVDRRLAEPKDGCDQEHFEPLARA